MAFDPASLADVAVPALSGPLRRLSKDFVVYGLGEVIVKSFSVIALPIYTRAFDPAEFGVLSYVLTLGGLLNAIVILGGDSAYARFFFEAKTREERQTITSTWLGFLGAWSLVISLMLLPFAGIAAQLSFGDPLRTVLFVAALLTTPVWLINRMCAQVLRNEFRASAFTALNIASTALLVGLSVIAVVVLHLGVLGVLLGTLVAELWMLPIRLWMARSMVNRSFSVPHLRQLLAFGVPIVPTSLAYWVFLTSDRVILGQVSTLEQLGLYSIANSLVGLAAIFASAFGQAWSPHAVKLFEEDPAEAPAVYARVMTYLLAGFGWLAVGLSVFGPELLALLTGPGYQSAAAAIAPLVIAMVAMATTQITAGGISLLKRTQYLAVYAWVAAVVNVLLNLVLDGSFGMLGAAWATAAAYVILTFLYLATSQRLWAIPYELRRSGLLVVLIVAFVLIGSALPGLDPAAIALKIAFSLAFVATAFGVGALDMREVHLARALLSRGGR